MAYDLNKVMLIGRLTRDPETRTIPSGKSVTSFSIATNRSWKDQEGNLQEQTEFHEIIAWERRGELAQQYLKKGSQAYIEGRLQTRSWVGSEDNVKRYRTEIIADNIIFLGSPGGGNTSGNTQKQADANSNASSSSQNNSSDPAQPKSPAPQKEEEIRIEDIPF